MLNIEKYKEMLIDEDVINVDNLANEDGTIEIINDETWCFQFLPIINE